MPLVNADQVKETTATTGTGTYDLAGAAGGFRTFVAGIGTGNQTYYKATNGTDWEVGIGTVTDAAPDTLSRDVILSSSNGGAAVNWGAGSKDIFCTMPAGRMFGRHSIWIPAVAFWARTTNGASPVNRELATGGDIQIRGWAFNATTETAIQCYLGLPKSYNKGVIRCQAIWTNPSGAGSNVVWGFSAGAYTDSDPMDTTDLGTEVTVTDAWLAANDIHVAAESGDITIGNTPANLDMTILQIARKTGDASDAMGGDAELLGVWVYYNAEAVVDI